MREPAFVHPYTNSANDRRACADGGGLKLPVTARSGVAVCGVARRREGNAAGSASRGTACTVDFFALCGACTIIGGPV